MVKSYFFELLELAIKLNIVIKMKTVLEMLVSSLVD